ncbi:DUF2207 domain-containing protein [Flavisphingomonas formosensis]|uniref:DUF2207 domain-containing protein n=1 Tax=Flavisphingomonas formosensis TaxID=861534 RepID=UPI0012F7FA00|nr:DUF2207 domain-containing protein [Sphingomonas formosensis]
MRVIARLIAAVLLLLAGLARAQDMSDDGGQTAGSERILSFQSDVSIARNGDLDVTETIRVVALGDRINHGIYRDFPTSYTSRYGQRTHVGFALASVERDGAAEPYRVEHASNGLHILIGDKDRLVPHGEHVYVLHYRTTRQIAYGRDSDELHWNVTGNGWIFPIDSAEARIRLPSAVPFGNRAVYTGPQGATDHNAAVVVEQPGLIVFRTTRPLDSHEGLTVAAAFPKGVLDRPGTDRRLGWWLQDWAAFGAALLSLTGIAGYYLRAWAKAGRNPRPGPVVPLFTPPDGLSAAACRYISRMKLDNRAFTAAIVQLGVLGRLHIRKAKDGWLSTGTTTLERQPGDGTAPPPEEAMLGALFPGSGDTLELKQANHSTLQGARRALERGLEAEYLGPLFLRNSDWAIYGLFLIPLAVLATSWIAILVQPDGGGGAAMPALGGIALLGAAWWLFSFSSRASGGTKLLAWLGLVLALAFGSILALTALIAALGAGQWAVLLPLIAIPLALSAFVWMYAPTAKGREVMDRIAGFRHYLGITEEDRLETLHPPEKTPELFERYLPYAIALDVENRWADRFAGVLAAAAATGAAAHGMGWYSGDGSSVWSDPGDFANSVGSALTSTISSASASPSSSSGSGGGGSSGGGGGGGGGGGW